MCACVYFDDDDDVDDDDDDVDAMTCMQYEILLHVAESRSL